MFRDLFQDQFYSQLLDELGENFTLERQSGGSTTSRGIFEREYLQQEFSDVIVENRNPTVQMYESLKPVKGDTVHVINEQYKIVELQPDGRGIVTCEMRLP